MNSEDQTNNVDQSATETAIDGVPEDTSGGTPEPSGTATLSETGITTETSTMQNAVVEPTPVPFGNLGPVEEPKKEVEEITIAPAVVDLGVKDNTAPVIQPAPAPVVETVVPVVENKEAAAPSDFQAFVEHYKTNGTAAQRAMMETIESYLESMAPGKVMDFNKGAKIQYQFWKMISNVVEHTPHEDFKKTWSILLAYFEEYKKGAFGERYVFRFSEYWHQSEDELKAYQRILNIIKLTCNPSERVKGLKQVDLTRSLEQGFSEQARQRIITYYQ